MSFFFLFIQLATPITALCSNNEIGGPTDSKQTEDETFSVVGRSAMLGAGFALVTVGMLQEEKNYQVHIGDESDSITIESDKSKYVIAGCTFLLFFILSTMLSKDSSQKQNDSTELPLLQNGGLILSTTPLTNDAMGVGIKTDF